MEVLQARIDSFKKSKRVKNPNKPSSTTTLRWPHPLDFKANPESLADAGFFYDPSYEDPDNVTCYVCDKELRGWEVGDDPHAIHWEKCGQTCCWAIVRCGLPNEMDKSGRFVFTDKTRVPTHKLMEKARFDTFDVGKGWIHDQVKNHSANSKMMARAGFVYTPQQSNDDLVTCLYCDTSLSGWDENDDPMEEHRRRENTCPFFSASVSGPRPTTRTGSQSQSTKPPSKSQSKPPSRSASKSKHQDILLPTKTHDGDPDNVSDSSQSTTAVKAASKTPRKGRSTSRARKSSTKTPKSKTRSTSKSSVKSVAQIDEDEEAPLTGEPTIKKKTRSRSKSVARSEPEHIDAEGEVQKKTLRSRPKAKPAEESEAKDKSAAKGKSSSHLGDPVIKQKTTVVEISSDEESEKDEKKVEPIAQSIKENTHGPTTTQVISQPQPEHEVRIAFSQSRKPKKSLTVEVVQPNPPSVPAESPIRNVDVVMGDTGDDHAPSTPQPQTPSKKDLTPPPHIVETSTTVEPPLIPALSKLPFTPLHALSEAELDMTVEEWIRYQMDVEYDKFRRDGERELQRFRNQAEEVRKAIEAL